MQMDFATSAGMSFLSQPRSSRNSLINLVMSFIPFLFGAVGDPPPSSLCSEYAGQGIERDFGGDGGHRTHMGLLPYDFESYAYANSATSPKSD